MGEPEQAVQARCGFLQSLSADAETLRIWDAEAVGRPGEGCFFSFERLMVANCRCNNDPRRTSSVRNFESTWRRTGTGYPRTVGNPGFFNRLLGAPTRP